MKLRIEIDEDNNDEIIIKCKSISDEIKLLQDVISNVIDKNAELVLHNNNSDYFINRNDILFFETADGKTAAHTLKNMYYSDYKLYELEQLLPRSFVRVSKSCIINCSAVSYINKNIAGASEVGFKNSYKKVFVSRMYFKVFKEKLEEMRDLK
ncbi:MAG: LytTR family DNA-binding domain-containing protein [Acutalibacteraceae bacterium]